MNKMNDRLEVGRKEGERVVVDVFQVLNRFIGVLFIKLRSLEEEQIGVGRNG